MIAPKSALPTSVATADPQEPIEQASAAETEMPSSENSVVVSQADVIGWVARGTSDDVILDRIEHARNAVPLTAADELQLRDAGATDAVIRALKATAWN